MTLIQERLFAMQDKQYAAFQAKLTPGVPMESFIGIRVPEKQHKSLQRRQNARNSCISFLTNTTMRTCFMVSLFPR